MSDTGLRLVGAALTALLIGTASPASADEDGGFAVVPIAVMASDAGSPQGLDASFAIVAVVRTTSVAALPVIAPGHEIEWLVDVIRTLRDLARSNRWGPFASLLLMAFASVGVWTKMKFGKGWSADFATDVTMVISILTFVSFQFGLLAAGAKPGDWFAALSTGVMTGAGAVGLWSWVGKRFFDRFLHPTPTANAIARAAAKAGPPPTTAPPTTAPPTDFDSPGGNG